MSSMEAEIEQIIVDQTKSLNRPDLFRRPLVAFSSADDERYLELKETIGEWHLTPAELLPDAKSVISYFIPFTKQVSAEPQTQKDGSPLWGKAYAVVNPFFEQINDAVSRRLSRLGFSVKAIQATHTYDPKEMKSAWSHRSAAFISGLGTFGANRLLITEKGSGGRFCTILTSSHLQAGQHTPVDKCIQKRTGACGLCYKICPANALSSDGIDRYACQEEVNKNDLKQRHLTGYSADTCGKCISICPFAYID